MEKTMYIHKMVVKKDAVRVNGADDIPAFLEDSIVLKEKQLVLTCVEGTETAPLGVVVGYEESSQTPTGFNCWVKSVMQQRIWTTSMASSTQRRPCFRHSQSMMNFRSFFLELTFATTRMALGPSRQVGASLPDFREKRTG